MDFKEKFRQAIKIQTWGSSEEPLLEFQEMLVKMFPAFHSRAERFVLSPYSVVYHLPSSEKEAVLFLAHYDVVPAETEKWSVDPFSAQEKDGYIYGRGSLDMKSILISLMEAAEKLCEENLKPKKDIWFAFGGDEERTGVLGAMKTVEWMANRGQRFTWILDEGTPVVENQIDGVDTPLALVSIAEKGYLSLKLSVEQEPGHSSRPTNVQAAAVLGRALQRIGKKPFPFKLTKPAETFFKQIAHYLPGVKGFVMRHTRLLGSLFFRAVSSSPTITAMLHTTVAMTQLSGSSADNVLPSEVSAIINLRLLEPWTVETAAEFIRKAVNDKRVKVSVHGMATDPVAPNENYRRLGWEEIKSAVEEAWPGIPLVPFIMVATTDSRFYQKLTDNIFRFSPHKLNPKELNTVHGHDERISEENLNRGFVFYAKLLKSL
jgi:carboxypeptidase PM20D1